MFERHTLLKKIFFGIKAESPLSICPCSSLFLGQVNLGDAVLRGLFSKWIEQHFRLNNGRSGACRQYRRSGRSVSSGSGNVNFNGTGDERHADNESPYSSGDESDSDSEQGDGWEYESSLTSPVSRESSQTSAKDGGVRQAGSGNTRPSHGLDVDMSASGASRDGDGSREGVGGQTGSVRAIRDDTVVLVTENDISGNEGMQRTLLQKRVCEFDGTEVQATAWSRRAYLFRGRSSSLLVAEG